MIGAGRSGFDPYGGGEEIKRLRDIARNVISMVLSPPFSESPTQPPGAVNHKDPAVP